MTLALSTPHKVVRHGIAKKAQTDNVQRSSNKIFQSIQNMTNSTTVQVITAQGRHIRNINICLGVQIKYVIKMLMIRISNFLNSINEQIALSCKTFIRNVIESHFESHFESNFEF